MSTIQDAARVRPSRWRAFGLTFAVTAALMMLWSLASPLMSIPDEPAHAIRAAAAARGEFTGGPAEASPTEMGVQVPRSVAETQYQTCFAFKSEQTPDCVIPVAGDPDQLVEGRTSAGLNNPLYYILVGWPTLFLSGDAALYAIRFVSSLLNAVLAGFAAAALVQLLRSRWVLAAGVVAVTPMTLFLGGAINPNGVEIFAAAALFSMLLVTLRQPSPGRLLWERAAIIVGATLLLATARSVAMLWVAVILVGALLVSNPGVLRGLRSRVATWVGVGLSAFACLFALWWVTVPIPLPPGLPAMGVDWSVRIGVETMLTNTFHYAVQWIGLFGWVDTPAPLITVAIWTTAMAVLILGALALARGRERLLVGYFVAGLIFLPPVLQAAVMGKFGFIWQGRYDLALAVCLLIAAGLALDSRFARQPSAEWSRLTQWGLWLLGFANGAAFVWTLKRYVVGERTWLEMLTSPSWTPPGGVVLVVVAYASVLFVSAWYLRRVLVRPAVADAPGATPSSPAQSIDRAISGEPKPSR